MTWWTGAALGFDLETDGVDPTEARIITAATVLVTPDNPAQPIELMLQPERDIPQGASDVHGITTEQAREEGIPRNEGVALLAETIAELARMEVPLVGHNVGGYDLTLLDREMRRTGVGRLDVEVGTGMVIVWIGGGQVASFPAIDTLVLDKAVDPFRKGKRQLSVVADHYGVPMAAGAAHGATADVFASLRIAWVIQQRGIAAADYVAQNGSDPMVFQMHPFMRHYAGRKDPLELVKRFAYIGGLSLPDLHAHQVAWKRAQAEGLREYFMTSGTGDPATVDGSWPLRTLTDGAGEIETVSTELI